MSKKYIIINCNVNKPYLEYVFKIINDHDMFGSVNLVAFDTISQGVTKFWDHVEVIEKGC